MDKIVAEILSGRNLTVLCPNGCVSDVISQIKNHIYDETHLPFTSSVYSQIKKGQGEEEEVCVEDTQSFILNRKEWRHTRLEYVYVIRPETVILELIARQIYPGNILVKLVKQ